MEESENFIHDKYGYCYYLMEPTPVIFNLYTEPEYRRKGHAREHLQFVINEIRETGYVGKIQIEVAPREDSIDSENLRLFYKSIGLDILEQSSNEYEYY
jgi:ribosomal protein S18 acetylase RimI-like enzyme